jgi:hypothetical protein
MSTRPSSPMALGMLGPWGADSAQSQCSLATIPSFVGPNRGRSLVCSRSLIRPPVQGYLAPFATPTRHVHERPSAHRCSDNCHRAGGMLDHVLAHGAEQQTGKPSAPPTPHHEKGGVLRPP